MYIVAVFIETLPGREVEMRSALLTYSRTCLERESGCRQFDIGQDPVEANAFFLYQVYRDQAAHNAHRESAHYADYRHLVDPWTKTRRFLTYELLSDHGQA